AELRVMRGLQNPLRFFKTLFLALLFWLLLCGGSAHGQSTPAGAGGGLALNTSTEQGSFLRRLFKAYSDEWWPPAAVANPAGAAPAFRADPGPVN
ncbi:MAG: hypothetical protein WAK89_10425, partial [Candidatus Sulfotelmatobacter sp.]